MASIAEHVSSQARKTDPSWTVREVKRYPWQAIAASGKKKPRKRR